MMMSRRSVGRWGKNRATTPAMIVATPKLKNIKRDGVSISSSTSKIPTPIM